MSLIDLLISLVVAGLIFWLVMWLVDFIGLPEPFNKVVKVIAAIIAFLIVINAVVGLGGDHPLVRWR